MTKFEVINAQGKTVMSTEQDCCIPDSRQLKLMADCGYKFKLDGKIINARQINSKGGMT